MIRRVESIERIQREQREFTPRKRPGTAAANNESFYKSMGGEKNPFEESEEKRKKLVELMDEDVVVRVREDADDL